MTLEFFIMALGVVLLLSVIASKMMYQFGVPTLIIFVSLGMILGSEGIGGFYYDDYQLTGTIAQIALIVIIFTGGFDTSWKAAKPIAPLAVTLSSVGTLLTAFVVGGFAHLFLKFSFLEAMLLGSIISSTDAASVFSILRTKNMNLKGDLAATLEIESGSNDPFAHMLTLLFLGLLQSSEIGFGWVLLLQLGLGLLMGLVIGYLGMKLINQINLRIDGLYMIIALAVMLLSFGITSTLGGNGYLAVYLSGMVLGNNPLTHKISLVKFFDGLTWLMQIFLFFTLGLLVFPSQVIAVFWQGLAVAVFISFIGRPLVIWLIMSCFKRPLKEIALVSWVGFRGAASIVFAIYPLAAGLPSGVLIFNIVFFVAFFSVITQGTLLLPFAKKLGLIEPEGRHLTTFTDYRGDTFADLLSIQVPEDSIVVGKTIMEIDIPSHILIALIKRGDSVVTPRGHTVVKANDVLMLASDSKEELLRIAHMERFRPKLKEDNSLQEQNESDSIQK